MNNPSPVPRLDKVHAKYSPVSSDVILQTLMGGLFLEASLLQNSLL